MQAVTTNTTTRRTFLDPVHHDIVLDRNDPAERLIIDLIDTPEFQRLRRIHQLGVSFFTFHGAESSRFTHCIGVMYITSQLIQLLKEQAPRLASPEWKQLILASALLHDIGHGPYSHVTEKILGYDHEDWSCRIISEGTEVNKVLRSYDNKLPDKITSVLKKTHTPGYITHLISSQLDCDRFDYLLRDSYFTGAAYGVFAWRRILSSLELDEANDRIVVVGEKGQTAVEDYLFARYSMYTQVYYHRKNLAARSLLAKIIRRAKEIGDKVCFMDNATKRWLSGERLDVGEYLFLDDVQMTYHIKCWLNDKDPILSDLAKRFLNRDLFNASRINQANPALLSEIEAKAKVMVKEAGLNPDYYVSIETTGIRPYDYYRPDEAHPQTNIMVRTERGAIKELSQISPTVEALVRGSFDTAWLIYPKEVKDKITKMMDDLLQ